MDSATREMLETVRKRRANLDQIEKLILEEFGESPNGATSTKRAYKRKTKGASTNGTRKTQIHDWLKKNGPATRSEIINGSGLPGGTVGGYLSSEKDLFESRDGKWYAR